MANDDAEEHMEYVTGESLTVSDLAGGGTARQKQWTSRRANLSRALSALTRVVGGEGARLVIMLEWVLRAAALVIQAQADARRR